MDNLSIFCADVGSSLAGAALLWSGLSVDTDLLHSGPLVIRPGAL